jgi:hypothetical protein
MTGAAEVRAPAVAGALSGFRFHNNYYANGICSGKVKMSHRGKLGMSHCSALRCLGVWHGLGGDE